MKIEKINNNQIRCIISMKDLEDRDISMKELVFTTDKTRKLFAEVIDTAHRQFGFTADAAALMVEATPTDKDEINIIITKAGSGTKSLRELFNGANASKLLEGAGLGKQGDIDAGKLFSNADLGRLFKTVTDIVNPGGNGMELPPMPFDDLNKVDASEAMGEKEQQTGESAAAEDKDIIRAYIYDSREAALAALKVISKSFSGENSLYLRKKTGTYFLVMHKGSGDVLGFNKICNVLTEYGAQVKPDFCSENYYREHYETVASPNAIASLLAK